MPFNDTDTRDPLAWDYPEWLSLQEPMVYCIGCKAFHPTEDFLPSSLPNVFRRQNAELITHNVTPTCRELHKERMRVTKVKKPELYRAIELRATRRYRAKKTGKVSTNPTEECLPSEAYRSTEGKMHVGRYRGSICGSAKCWCKREIQTAP